MVVKPKFLLRSIRNFFLGITTAVAMQLPLQAAENIFFTYGPIKLTVRVASLEKFVETGEVDANLRFLFNLIGTSAEEQAKAREALQLRADVDPLLISRFFNTSIGEGLLSRAGFSLNIPMGLNGKYAIRAALIEAALDEENGLSLINFIRKYPTDIQLQGEAIEQQAKIVALVVEATEYFTEEIAELSAKEAESEPPLDMAQLQAFNPKESGEYGVAPKQTWNLYDEQRDRRFYVDVYRPQRYRPGKTPVVIVSHGLASRPEDYDQIGKAIASYGFLVAMPQHPGSDYIQAQALLDGTSRQVYYPSDFIDRPQDISYVIDELERRNAGEFAGRLNLTEVGVGGHSFGGYTVLAVAGATIDWDYLQQECDINKKVVPNTALLIQCDVLNLPRQDYQFRDPRVSAVIAANPVNSAVFGEKGLSQITIPVIMMGGNYDPATPFVLEQVRSFPWLGSQEKYLSLFEGQAHVDFSKLDVNISNTIQSLEQVTLPEPSVLQSYGASLIIPFYLVHIAKEEGFRPYLDSAARYAQDMSQDQEFKFYVITEESVPELEQDIKIFQLRNAEG